MVSELAMGFHGDIRAVSVLLAAMSIVMGRYFSNTPWPTSDLWYRATLPGRHSRPAFGRASHEIVFRLCRVVSRRYFVNCIAERSGSVATLNRLSTSERHGRCAEGTCAEAGGDATCAEAVGKYRGISPDIVNRSNAIFRAGFSIRADCQA